ncbi:MAG: SGNH/GDSL hydrolase family protein, partial [Acidobacteriota bacterium]
MSANSSKQSPQTTRPRHLVGLSILISLIAVGGTLGGFFIGRQTSSDAYVKKVGALLAIENNGTTLYQALGNKLDDPLTAQALAKLYGVPVGDRDALAQRLRSVAWLPPYRPAPFVGHMARPMLGADPHINILGFRDDRESYVTKSDQTVRIFITGGSTAWGSGASSQKNTISYLLEQILDERMSPATGYRYEVINTAFPGWTTTQEKLLIQQRLVDMHPDVIIMFTGNNDVHWSREQRDIRWLYGPMDQNYMTLLNELYRSSGHPEWTFAVPVSSRPVACSDLAEITARNVAEAASSADRAGVHLIFALQPNIVSTAKRLSRREQQLPEVQHKTFWDACYQALRDRLGRISARNYRLLDLSRSFGDIGEDTEVFVDSYHFADLGNRRIAEALANQIDWSSIKPGPAVIYDGAERLKIISFDPTESAAGEPFNQQSDGTSAMRVIPSSINQNLLVVFDQSVLPTTVANNALTASVPASLYAAKGEHRVYVV